MKKFTSKTQTIGEQAENIAVRFLSNKGFQILERNYTVPQGEVDIVALKNGTLHFVEVKSLRLSVSSETSRGILRPEDNFHDLKIKRLIKAVTMYQIHKHISHETLWQIDLVTVMMNFQTRKATVRLIENATI